jgi:hypothetical protein
MIYLSCIHTYITVQISLTRTFQNNGALPSSRLYKPLDVDEVMNVNGRNLGFGNGPLVLLHFQYQLIQLLC